MIWLLDLLELFIKGISSVWLLMLDYLLWMGLVLELGLGLRVFPALDFFIRGDVVVLLGLVVEVLSVCLGTFIAVVHVFVVFHYLFVAVAVVWLGLWSLWGVVGVWVGDCVVLVVAFVVVFLKIAFLFFLRGIFGVFGGMFWKFRFGFFLSLIFLYLTVTCLFFLCWVRNNNGMVLLFSWGFCWFFFWGFYSGIILFWLFSLGCFAYSAIILSEVVLNGLLLLLLLLPW